MFHAQLLGPEKDGICLGLLPERNQPRLVHDLHFRSARYLGEERHRGVVNASPGHRFMAVVIGIDVVLVVEARGGNLSLVRNHGA